MATNDQLTPYLPRILDSWPDRESTGHVAMDGSLVFMDLSGFTAMSERLARLGKRGAEEMTDVLNSIYGELQITASSYGGDLIKFGGDALLLFFNGEEHAPRACTAAYAMQSQLSTLGRVKTDVGTFRIRASAGVHTGTFHFFLAGTSHRELVLTGDAASRTAEAEHEAEATETLLTRAVANTIDPSWIGPPKGDGYLLGKVSTAEYPAGANAATARNLEHPERFIPVALRPMLNANAHQAEHRQATIGFVQFRGTNRLITDGKLDEVHTRIDSLIAAVQAEAESHDICFLSTDVDVDGGKVILVAGVPNASESDEERMLHALRAIADGDYGLDIRCGVNRGHVFAGDVGPPFRSTYTVIGDTVNMAARLMAQADPSQVLATRQVIDASRTEFAMDEPISLTLKGIDQPVDAYSIGHDLGGWASTDDEGTPLIGREEELSDLRSIVEGAARGHGALVEVVGEAGLGKSRLVDELRRTTPGALALVANCPAYQSSTPYFPFRTILSDAFGIPRNLRGEAAADALALRVSHRAKNQVPWLPLAAIPMNISLPDSEESSQIQPQFRRERSHQAVIDLLDTMTSGLVLMVFEDGQWMDGASVELLLALGRAAASRPWVICVTRRAQEAGLGAVAEEERQSSVVQLGPLDDRASKALVRSSAKVALPPNDVTSIAERAGGNPMFIRELTSVVAQGAVDTLPDRIETLIASRMDRLEPNDRNLLRYASVQGTAFDLELLRMSLPDAIRDAETATAWDRVAEFVTLNEPNRGMFVNTLFRDAAYEGLPFRLRREIHGRVGNQIEAAQYSDLNAFAELLALHFYRANSYQKAWNYSIVAGDLARGKSANAEAATFYEQALEVVRHTEGVTDVDLCGVEEALGDVSELTGAYAKAAAAYDSARRVAKDNHSVSARLLYKRGILRERGGEYVQALRWFGRGLKECGDAQDSATTKSRIELSLAYAGVRFRMGRYQECARWCRSAIGDAERIGERAGLAHAYYLLSHAASFLNESAGEDYGDHALSIFEELGDLLGQANTLNNLGVEAYFHGRWDDALAHYRRSMDARQRAGDVVNVAVSMINIGEVLSDQGRLSEAEVMFRDALEVFEGSNYALGIAVVSGNLGRALTRQGRVEAATEYLNDALAKLQEMGAEGFVLETETRIAENLLVGGDREAASSLAEELLERSSKQGGASLLQATLHRVLGYCAFGNGDENAAIRHFTQSLEQAQAENAEFDIALTLNAMGSLLRRADPDEERSAAQATVIFDKLGVRAVPLSGLVPTGH